MTRKFISIILILSILIVFSCEDEEPTISVTSITISENSLTLIENEKSILSVVINPSNATNKDVTWKSSNTTIASVDFNGEVTAHNPGSAVIIVTTEDGNKTATCSVTVESKTIPVTGVSMNKSSLTLIEGGSEILIATVTPVDATNKEITWKSSDDKIATVDSNGKVTAVKSGNAIITVTTEDGNKTATCSVTVEEKTIPVTGVSMNKSSLTLIEESSEVLIATVSPVEATNKNVIWKSSDDKIATVDTNGKVTAVKSGNAVITVTTEDGNKTATCSVTVEAKTIPVTGVSMNKSSLTLIEESSEVLIATVSPVEATNKNVIWKSSDDKIATVDSNGKVTAVKSGNAIITVTTEDGNKTATCSVTVEEKTIPVTGVSMNKSSLTLIEESSEVLIATVSPVEATNKNVIWKSSDDKIATVDTNGEVTAIKSGNAVITVTTEDGNYSAICNLIVVTVNKPTLTTSEVTNITQTTASSGGFISDDGGADIVLRGVCWSTNQNPTISDDKTENGDGAGPFISEISNLKPSTTYYIRSYATNIAGTSYGNQISFKTKDPIIIKYGDGVTDIDGNVYKSVIIGTQEWTSKNLLTTKFNDGTNILHVTNNDSWSLLSTPGYCWYDNDKASYGNEYGALYNWYAVETEKLCPEGWHVPSKEEWEVLSNYIGGAEKGGEFLKSKSGWIKWDGEDGNGTDDYGFNALPAGARHNVNGEFVEFGLSGIWWTFSEYDREYPYASNYGINSNYPRLENNNYSKNQGFSIRCVRNK